MVRPLTQALLFGALAALSATSIPVLSVAARVLLVLYGIGWAVLRILALPSSHATRSVVSIACSLAIILLLIAFMPPNSVRLRVAFALVAILLGAYAFVKPARAVPLHTRWWLPALACSIPLVLIFVINPAIPFLSDGWWHGSLYGVIKHASVPFPNPWLGEHSVAYPFGLPVLLAYLFGDTPIFPGPLFIASTLVCIALASSVIAESFGTRAGASRGFWTAFGFLYISTIGSIIFCVSAARAVFSSGISSYVEFLRAHAGPHMWYTAMKVVYPIAGADPVGVFLPFQGAAMMAFLPILLFFSNTLFCFSKTVPNCDTYLFTTLCSESSHCNDNRRVSLRCTHT